MNNLTKKESINTGDWFDNEHGNRVDVISVAQGWCMVKEEGKKKPYVLPEEFVLATFNP